MGAVIQHGGRQLVGGAAFGPRLPVRVLVVEQQADAGQIDHAPVGQNKLSL